MKRRGLVTHVLWRIIWAPANEGDFAPRPLARLQLILDVVNGVAATNALLALAVFALGVEELLAEGRPVSFLGCLFDDNFFPVVADLIDDVLDILAKLELVEGADAFGGYGDTGSQLAWAMSAAA